MVTSTKKRLKYITFSFQYAKNQALIKMTPSPPLSTGRREEAGFQPKTEGGGMHNFVEPRGDVKGRDFSILSFEHGELTILKSQP